MRSPCFSVCGDIVRCAHVSCAFCFLFLAKPLPQGAPTDEQLLYRKRAGLENAPTPHAGQDVRLMRKTALAWGADEPAYASPQFTYLDLRPILRDGRATQLTEAQRKHCFVWPDPQLHCLPWSRALPDVLPFPVCVVHLHVLACWCLAHKCM